MPSRSLSISVSIDSIIQLWPGIPLSNAKLAVRPPAQLGLSIARISGGTPCILSCFPTEKPPATSRRICFALASGLGDAPYLRSYPVFKHLLVDDDVRKGRRGYPQPRPRIVVMPSGQVFWQENGKVPCDQCRGQTLSKEANYQANYQEVSAMSLGRQMGVSNWPRSHWPGPVSQQSQSCALCCCRTFIGFGPCLLVRLEI